MPILPSRRARRSSRSRLRRSIPALVVLASVLLASCAAPAPAEPDPSPTTSAPPTVAVDTTTLRTLIDSPAESPTLTLGDPVNPLADETATEIAYPSGGLTVGGVLRTPAGADDLAPVVVVVHGSVDPARYDSGTDLVAEQRALLGAGYVVVALDMRGYAESDPADPDLPVVDPGFGWETVLDWGMALDVVNGLRLAADGDIPGADPQRVGLLGHSLGGLLSIDAAVIAPGLSQLVVALSAPSTDLAAALAGGDVANTEGLPSPDDPMWVDVSPVTFFDRATEPLLLISGSADDVAPAAAAQATADAWRAAGGRAEAIVIDGADHALAPRRADVAAMVVAAFDTALADR